MKLTGCYQFVQTMTFIRLMKYQLRNMIFFRLFSFKGRHFQNSSMSNDNLAFGPSSVWLVLFETLMAQIKQN